MVVDGKMPQTETSHRLYISENPCLDHFWGYFKGAIELVLAAFSVDDLFLIYSFERLPTMP